ncbi:hypothetical protein SAMN02745165_03531 [Malonomonas rubra DSM 5091]|uniref:Uncharacterized protein n=1 Tax=Malonomonas rubra DSM 5091 TaxID=1122189 RepID=A0A1M6N773_MALRU|nr:hypothetical protein [Malonomonas rubra]SHJ91595.1 hypothetical protein SAMN02745165_03531 [Malonomonas rubra DSM 5091]
MSISTLHTRWITRLFVLIYLLLSFSTANAAFWCLDEQNPPHLETSPIGKCWTDCDPENPTLQSNKTELFWATAEEDCLDSPVYSSALTSTARTNFANRVALPDIDSLNPPLIANPDLEVSRFVNLNLPSRLPTSQAISALRTVVLLH